MQKMRASKYSAFCRRRAHRRITKKAGQDNSHPCTGETETDGNEYEHRETDSEIAKKSLLRIPGFEGSSGTSTHDVVIRRLALARRRLFQRSWGGNGTGTRDVNRDARGGGREGGFTFGFSLFGYGRFVARHRSSGGGSIGEMMKKEEEEG